MPKKRFAATRAPCLAVRALALFAVNCLSGITAAGTLLPVPGITLYPGDIITEQALVDREFPEDSVLSKTAAARSRADLVGKVSRRTLLPGQPIPPNAVGAPTVVANGTKVQILFEEETLRILALGTALQSGSAGEVISVRNIASGLTVSGTVQADGTIHVGGG
jgi:flagellar basal body P-ring formation protein FlgA